MKDITEANKNTVLIPEVILTILSAFPLVFISYAKPNKAAAINPDKEFVKLTNEVPTPKSSGANVA